MMKSGKLSALSPVAVIVATLTMVIGGLGIADAATGGDFLLGKSNSESHAASLSNTKGTPLFLSAPKNKAPLAVNRSTMVKNLNANFVGGLSASDLKPTGGDDFKVVGLDIALPPKAEAQVAKTGKLAAGTYYVTATAEIDLAPGDSGALCEITLNKNVDHSLSDGGETGGPFVQAAETVAVSVPRNATLQEWCAITGSAGGSTAPNAGITAIRILSSHGTKPAR